MMALAQTPPYSEAYCEAQYHPQWLRRDWATQCKQWSTLARMARETVPRARLNIPYGPTSGERVDLFLASNLGAPLFIFIHGGQWRDGDKSDFSWLATTYCQQAISVAIPNFGSIANAPIEQLVTHLLRFAAWLWRRASDYGIDRQRMLVCGQGSGAHLAAMLLAAQWPVWERDLPQTLFRAGMLLSGIFDLEPLRYVPDFQRTCKLTSEHVVRLSPLHMGPSGNTRVVVAYGDEDSFEIKRQSIALARTWSAVSGDALEFQRQSQLSLVNLLADSESRLVQEIHQLLGAS